MRYRGPLQSRYVGQLSLRRRRKAIPDAKQLGKGMARTIHRGRDVSSQGWLHPWPEGRANRDGSTLQVPGAILLL